MKQHLYRNLLLIAASLGHATAYTLHEWGTFTSVSASNGKLLSGLQREEENLPGFVHALDGMKNSGPRSGLKGLSPQRAMKNVTIKMETPVIYFYSDHAFQASVEVGFQGGSISQWFPQRASGESVPKIVNWPSPIIDESGFTTALNEKDFTEAGGLDFSQKRNGKIAWNIDVLAPDAPRSLSFKSGEMLNWTRPRNSKSNIIKSNNEFEHYLFYRGVGNFELPLTFSIDAAETLQIKNHTSEKIPFLLVQEVTPEKKVRYYSITDGLNGTETKTIPESDFNTPDAWQSTVYQEMAAGLTRAGLNHEEADSMIQTWWESYFEKEGLRVFWIVPETVTEQILPLQVTPKPKSTVRVLVGRSEVLRPRFEAKLMEDYHARKNPQKSGLWFIHASHRYGLAFEERVREMLAP